MGFDILHSTGYVGATKKNGFGCVCHGFGPPSDSVIVWVAGPESVRVGSMNNYYILMRGGPAVAGGFNVASGRGALSAGDSTSYLLDGELTQVSPKFFSNDTVRWKFRYQAPLAKGIDTIFSVGNSVNNDGNPTGDEYNFGSNFLVKIVDTVVSVHDDVVPLTFHLYQNYPNPFNPATTISYELEHESFIDLSVYTIEGRHVISLVRGRVGAGEHSVRFEGTDLAGGLYIYRLRIVRKNNVLSTNNEELTISRKMLLLK